MLPLVHLQANMYKPNVVPYRYAYQFKGKTILSVLNYVQFQYCYMYIMTKTSFFFFEKHILF